jgi:HSP20 family protein
MDTSKPVTAKASEPSMVPRLEVPFAFPFFRRFGRDFESLFDRSFFKPWFTETEPALWVPTVEVFEKGNEFVVRAEVPGMKKEEITLEITENELVMSGERKKETEEKKEGFYRSERTYGSFYRAIPLPEGVSIDRAAAAVRDGVLEVKMPIVHQEARRRRLEIGEPAAGEKAGKHAA